MQDRRRLILNSAAAMAGWAGLPGSPALAQPRTADDDGFGSPAATSPFAPEVYRERRRRLMSEMKGGVAVLYSATTIDPAGALSGLARQGSDFSYLTGMQDEVGAALVLAPSERTHREFLLLAPRNPETERWEGLRLPLGQSVRRRTGFENLMRTDYLGQLVTGQRARAGHEHRQQP